MSTPGPRAEPNRVRYWVFFAVSVVAVVAVGALAGWIGSRTGAPTNQAAVGRTNISSVCNAADVARRVLPSVVTIEVASASGEGSGSGEVIDASGIVLTNDHVIAAGGGGSITVRLDDGTELPAEIAGRDPRTDLAVLRTNPDRRLPALSWGNSNRLVVGEPVVALGAPLGLSGSVTTGVVSALGRSVPVPTGDGTGSTVLTGAIQTDASINPGNSGGALVDCDGRLVGINTAIATIPSSSGETSGSIGIGFAVPAAVARPIADALRTDGTVAHPTAGAQTTPVALRSSAGAISVGLQITAVTRNGPAADADLQVGDVITGIDGVDALHPETITYVRDGRQEQATVTLRDSAAS
ncbi:trypsin-like peptidase domain-containing protein [Curtobacterium sp. MCSS17_005]|uniref:S1C family serine protease n=1 Tax=Curtobacterium sp. MCSS17_005 TaxID=2175641 RepID=UPI000DA86B07|nr:trypsin-like peptidase domain-containing protein [Curtobacterium sp. MCSS17_005]WIB34362.1 trypsin-like peptidase domain-containing protein [Curtobacterium sp. MCSS17_005]